MALSAGSGSNRSTGDSSGSASFCCLAPPCGDAPGFPAIVADLHAIVAWTGNLRTARKDYSAGENRNGQRYDQQHGPNIY
jgi:hypothetical protein